MGPALVIAALLAAGDAPPAPTLAQAARASLAGCLEGGRWQADAGHTLSTADEAPGLPAGSLIARIPTASGRLFAYQDGGGSVIECGVAVYGDASGIELSEVRQQIERSDARLQPASPDDWRLSASPGARSFYWGDRLSPGLSGVMLRYAPPGSSGPSLQVDKHTVLVR